MRVVRSVHAWAGLLLSIAILAMALSGTLLVFKPQWLRATVPGAAQISLVTPAEAALTLAAAEAHFGGIRWVIFAGPEIGLHEVAGISTGGYLRPQTREPVQVWENNERFVDLVFDFHHHLLSGKTGTMIAGVVALLAALLMLTGVVIWWPARHSFRGRPWPSAPAKRSAWVQAHRDLGILTAPLALGMTLTGAALALPNLTTAVLGIERAAVPPVGGGTVDWLSVLSAAQARFPDAALRSVSWPTGGSQPALIRLRQPAEWHANGRTMVYVDPATSRIVAVEDALVQPTGTRVRDALWPVHASKIGGLAWKAATFLAGIALTLLSLYGVEAYRRKLLPRPRLP